MTWTPKIIGFCGYPGSGKDEAAKVLVNQGWQRVAFAEPLRQMALAIDPWVQIDTDGSKLAASYVDGKDNFRVAGSGVIIPQRLSLIVEHLGWIAAKRIPEVRRLLQRIGTEAVRDIIGPDTWVQLAERSMQSGKHVVITDVRFANEAEMIKRRGGLLCWIDRESAKEKFADSKHASEQYQFEIEKSINNNGSIAELHNAVLELAGLSL